MRIGLVTSMKFGLTQFTLRDIHALRARGHDVRLFSLLNEPGPYQPMAEWPLEVLSKATALRAMIRILVTRPRFAWRLGRHASRNDGWRDLAAAAQFSKGLSDADLIFSYFGDHKLFVGYYASLITGRPLAVTIRAYELYRNPNPALFLQALARCEIVLTITEHNRRMLIEEYGVDPERIRIARQIVDLDEFRPRDVVTILIVGYFAHKKGHDVLLQSLSSLGRDDVEVWVVGDRNPSVVRVDVRSLAAELGVEDRVAFFGVQSGVALRALYRECDIFCLPSRTDKLGDKEGFPNVIAEAMAFGKPIVSTRHAGIPEALDDILVDENDVDGLVSALLRLIDDPELRHRLGARNRARAELMFSPANTDVLVASLEEARGRTDAAEAESH